jgi:D-glycero-D-manno-heptose 1,7-bisphosphate phosphatase
VFLDRDGVLNEVPGSGGVARSPGTVAETRLVPTADAAMRELRAAGFTLIALTNQPDVARGGMTRDDALAITEHVVAGLGLDDAYVCMHDDADSCPCRKPRPGMLVAAATDWQLELEQCWLIGDRWVDVAAASGAGVRSVLLERSYSWAASGAGTPPAGLRPHAACRMLADAVDVVLGSGPDRPGSAP